VPERDYERLPIEEFGRRLLETNDLDPIYVALCGLLKGAKDKDRDWVKRWLVAYWCYYHAGVACHMADRKASAFWDIMMTAAENQVQTPVGGRWPRGHERRHFRGEQGTDAIAELAMKYSQPEKLVDYVMGTGGHFTDVAQRVKEHRGFGPWMAFKVADMAERVFKISVDFSESHVFMFTDPTKAALMLWRKRKKLPDTARPKDKKTEGEIIHGVVEYLLMTFRGWKAPPDDHRPLGLQEIETILCKWKSHMNGHYPIYNDIDEIREGLAPWAGKCASAKRFLQLMPARPPNISATMDGFVSVDGGKVKSVEELRSEP
jgi:hypothetical protein